MPAQRVASLEEVASLVRDHRHSLETYFPSKYDHEDWPTAILGSDSWVWNGESEVDD